jgi:hypothetical protein
LKQFIPPVRGSGEDFGDGITWRQIRRRLLSEKDRKKPRSAEDDRRKSKAKSKSEKAPTRKSKKVVDRFE